MAAVRTLLFAPGSDRRKVSKLANSGSSGVVIDLEDAVADSLKVAARQITREALSSFDFSSFVAVRINCIASGRAEGDLEQTFVPRLDAIVIPKLESSDDLQLVDEILNRLERLNDPGRRPVRLIGLIETARGLSRCREILADAPERVLTIGLGSGDLANGVGLDVPAGNGAGVDVLSYPRGVVTVEACAAGLEQPFDGPFLNLDDENGLAIDCARSRAYGLRGRVAVHPRQVAVIERTYGQHAPDDLENARRIVEAFESAERDGVASVRVGSQFVDYPIYRRAQRIVAEDEDRRR